MMHPLNRNVEQVVLTALSREHLLDAGMSVCVCFSGGVDSAVLLHILLSLREKLDIRLSACHFNHQIRGMDAEQDADFCALACQRAGIPFFCGSADVPALQKQNGTSMEEAARDARYAWFDVLGKKERIDRFVTAHHKNDQAETVLYRLIRGTTPAGLCGIPWRRASFIRPMLGVSRSEIEAYAREHGVAYRTDHTNFSQQYTRNYIRHTLLPAMQQVNPAVLDALSRLTVSACEDQEFLNSLLPSYCEMQEVASLPDALLRRTVARNFLCVSGQTLCGVHVNRICQAVRCGKSVRIGLPGGFFACLQDGLLSFEQVSADPGLTVSSGILQEGETLLCGGMVRVTLQKNPALDSTLPQRCGSRENVYNLSTEIPLSCDGIYGIIHHRSRLPGDRLQLHGVNRSVKKLFSEHKIPLSLRQLIPVFYDEQGIFCIPFVAVADRAYVRTSGRALASETQKLIFLRVEIAAEATRKVVECL